MENELSFSFKISILNVKMILRNIILDTNLGSVNLMKNTAL